MQTKHLTRTGVSCGNKLNGTGTYLRLSNTIVNIIFRCSERGGWCGQHWHHKIKLCNPLCHNSVGWAISLPICPFLSLHLFFIALSVRSMMMMIISIIAHFLMNRVLLWFKMYVWVGSFSSLSPSLPLSTFINTNQFLFSDRQQHIFPSLFSQIVVYTFGDAYSFVASSKWQQAWMVHVDRVNTIRIGSTRRCGRFFCFPIVGDRLEKKMFPYHQVSFTIIWVPYWTHQMKLQCINAHRPPIEKELFHSIVVNGNSRAQHLLLPLLL